MSENNVNNNDKGRAYLDFWRLARASNDYTEEDLEKFKYFLKGPFRVVKPDQLLLVINVLNPTKSNTYVLKEGFHVLNPILEESILVPNPTNPIVIDYKPKDDKDRKDNFTFVPDYVSDDEQSEKDEIYCDYKVSVRIVDPIQYFYSSNGLENLRADIVGVLREFIASKSKKDIMTKFSRFSINEIDPYHVLDGYRSKFGLEVVEIGFNSVKESDAVREARNKVTVEKQNIEVEKAKAKSIEIGELGKKRAKEIATEADVNRINSIATALDKNGLSNEDKAFLLSNFIKGDAVRDLSNSEAHVWVNFGENWHEAPIMPGFDPRLYYDLRDKADKADRVIDVEAEDAEANGLAGDGNIRKRRK